MVKVINKLGCIIKDNSNESANCNFCLKITKASPREPCYGSSSKRLVETRNQREFEQGRIRLWLK